MIFSARMNTERRREKRDKIRYVPKRTVTIPSDVLGSFTGVPKDGAQPVQDTDDL